MNTDKRNLIEVFFMISRVYIRENLYSSVVENLFR